MVFEKIWTPYSHINQFTKNEKFGNQGKIIYCLQ